MTDPLSLERFRDLADAYGGVIARWPEQHRAAAMQMAGTPNAAEILAQALMLDETLDARRVSPPTPELERLSCPRPRRFPAGVSRRARGCGGRASASLRHSVGRSRARRRSQCSPIELPSDSGTSLGDVAAQES